MIGGINLLSVFSTLCLLLPLGLVSQEAGRDRSPAASVVGLSERIFEQLESAPAEPRVDVVRLRLLHNEIRRWIREASVPEDDSFDEWAFGGEQGEERFRHQLVGLLNQKLELIDRHFQLTEPQRRKVRLAGQGDIKHLLSMVDDSRREFERAVLDVRRLPDLQKQLRLIDLRVSNGPFEAGSMLAKTLRKMFAERRITVRPSKVIP